jgi:CRISPR-associated protein Cas5d
MPDFYDRTFCLEVWGDYACFTRPEMKVERVSYDIITPSATRAIFESIFWKPAFYWKIRKIEVLNEIKWISVRRNELAFVISNINKGIIIDEIKPDGKPKYRQQRAGLFLKDVKYRLYADLVFIPPSKRPDVQNHTPEYLIDADEREQLAGGIREEHSDENPGKYNAMFERRAKKGQCFNQPYFGCREFSCYFKLVDPEREPSEPIDETRDLGFMLYDMDFPNSADVKPTDIKPAFFRAKMNHGVIEVPDWDSEEVRR